MRPIAAIVVLVALPFGIVAQTPVNSDAQALRQLGRDALARGEAKNAVEYFEKAVALAPSNAEYHYQLANAYELTAAEAGMLSAMPIAKQAKAELERACSSIPISSWRGSHCWISTCKRRPSPEGAPPRRSSRPPRSASATSSTVIARSRIHAAAKKPDLVRKEYDDTLKERPGFARARYFVGVYQMLTEKNYKSAGDAFESVVKLDPSYMPAYFQIGHVAALGATNLSRGEEALTKYPSYIPKHEEPSIARAHFWLGSLYEKQGKKAEAKASYAASLRINPTQKDAEAAMKRVSS